MKNKVLKVGDQFTRADFVRNTYNEESRTIDVVFATDTPVLRYSWDGPFYEILDMAGHITDRSAGSLPVLNNHDRYSGVQGIIGRAENVRLENGKWVASVRFSKREDVQPIIDDIREGIIQDISVGYSVRKYERSPDAGEVPTYIARQWESKEISFVTVPADHNSKVRGDESQLRSIEVEDKTENPKTNKSDTMKREQIIAALQKRGIEVPENATDEQLLELMGRKDTPAPVPTPGVSEDEKRQAIEAERKRSSEIIEAVRAAKLGNEFAEKLIKDGVSVDDARKAVIDEIAKADGGPRGTHSAGIRIGADEADKVRAAMENAFAHRVGADKELKDEAREFRGMSLIRMAEESLVRKGIRVGGLSQREIAEAALNLRGYHSSSDFPIILGNTVNRVLRQQYEYAPRTFQAFTRRGSAKDFREMTKAQLSGIVGSFDKIAEGAEYKAGSMTEAKEAYKVEKYGKIIAITWETLINDDLDAFTRIPAAIAQKAAQKQSDIVYAILTGNPTMADGVALFNSTHGNLAASGTAIDVTNLAKARAAMRKQKGLEGDFINVTPSFLIVGPDKETEAQQIINATIVATKDADTNVFKGSLQIVVDPRLTGNQWYLAANPNQVDTIEYAFLEGEGELFTEQRTGFEVDGLEIKARMVFGAKAIDHRGLYKNAGA